MNMFGVLFYSIILLQVKFMKCDTAAKGSGDPKGIRHHVASDLGSPSGIKEYPFQALIERKNGPLKCGAAIISKNFVLSAARCNGPDLSKLAVRTGVTLVLPDEGVSHNIKKVHVHPKFELPKRYDAALFEIDGEIEFSAASRPINLMRKDEQIFDDMKMELIGWSEKMNARAGRPSPDSVFLMKTSETLVTHKPCAAAFPKMNVMDDNFCNDPYSGRTACMRYPGSSLVDHGKLYGIMLNDFSCEFVRLPKLFVNVADLRDWVLEVTGIPESEDVSPEPLTD